MRIHLPPEVINFLRDAATPPEVRRAIRALSINPRPPDALAIPNKPGRYHLFESGFWIVYDVEQDRSETVISVRLIEKN
jgi:hypothetical protein